MPREVRRGADGRIQFIGKDEPAKRRIENKVWGASDEDYDDDEE